MGGGIYQSDADWVRVLNDKGLLTGGKIRGGTLQADGRVSVGEYLDIESTAVEGQLSKKLPANPHQAALAARQLMGTPAGAALMQQLSAAQQGKAWVRKPSLNGGRGVAAVMIGTAPWASEQ